MNILHWLFGSNSLFSKWFGYYKPHPSPPPPPPPPPDPPPPPNPVLPGLRAEGQHFVKEDGTPFTAIEASGFTLYQQYLDGVDITPVLQQLKDLGFNMVRVFGMYNNPPTPDRGPGAGGIGHFIPDDYGDAYWTKLRAFYQLLAQYGLYGEFTAFADTRAIMPDVATQRLRVQKVMGAFDGITNALVEWVNEGDQTINVTDVQSEVGRVPNVLTSRGSYGSQGIPTTPHLDYVTFHTNGAFEEARKVGHNAMEIWSGRTLTNETSRSPYASAYKSATFPYDAAAGAALLCAGSCFHSDDGKYGRLLTGASIEHAKQWVAGANSISLGCQSGPYIHDARCVVEENWAVRADGTNNPDYDPNRPTYLRVYYRGTPSCVVRIRY